MLVSFSRLAARNEGHGGLSAGHRERLQENLPARDEVSRARHCLHLSQASPTRLLLRVAAGAVRAGYAEAHTEARQPTGLLDLGGFVVSWFAYFVQTSVFCF